MSVKSVMPKLLAKTLIFGGIIFIVVSSFVLILTFPKYAAAVAIAAILTCLGAAVLVLFVVVIVVSYEAAIAAFTYVNDAIDDYYARKGE